MSTTPKGFPYPEPSAPVAQGANDIKALATAVDTKYPVMGKFSGTTSASGVVNIPHGLGVVPASAVVCMGAGNTAIILQIAQPAVTSSSTTNLGVTITRSDTGAPLVSSAVGINWIVMP